MVLESGGFGMGKGRGRGERVRLGLKNVVLVKGTWKERGRRKGVGKERTNLF